MIDSERVPVLCACTAHPRFRTRCVAWSARVGVLALLLAACVWGVERALWGPSGASGLATAEAYTPGSHVRVWASSVSPGDGSDIGRPWDWLPLCWPPEVADERPRANSLLDVITGRTSGASVYALPILDVSRAPAIDPDLYPVPPTHSLVVASEWRGRTACTVDFAHLSRAEADSVVARWGAVARSDGVLHADVDGGLPVLWLRAAYTDGRPPDFRVGIPLGRNDVDDGADDAVVYTHHAFTVWCDSSGGGGGGGGGARYPATPTSVVRVTVEPSRPVVWPPPQATERARREGGNATVLRWTWDVALVHSALPATRRLDVLFTMGGSAVQVPFLAVGVGVAGVVTLVLNVCLVRVLGRRVAASVYPVGGRRLSELLSRGETVGREWVTCGLNGEHFRRPARAPRLLAALVGAGLQLQALILGVCLLSWAGFLWIRWLPSGGASPVDRLASLAIVLTLATHLVSGAAAARLQFRWHYHERTLHSPSTAAADDDDDEDGISLLHTVAAEASPASPPPLPRDEGIVAPPPGEGASGASEGVALAPAAAVVSVTATQSDAEAAAAEEAAVRNASWALVRGKPAFVLERILQDWAGIYLDARTCTLTAALLPLGCAPLYVPMVLLAGGSASTVGASVAAWCVLAWFLAAVGAHAAVAWAQVPDDAPRPVRARRREVPPDSVAAATPRCPRGLLTGVVAPLAAGGVSAVGGGLFMCLALLLSLSAGGYVWAFPFLGGAFVLWLYQSRVAAVLVAWARLRELNWHWHWTALASGGAVGPMLVLVLGVGAQSLVQPSTARAGCALWLAVLLASLCLALAHAATTYLRVASFLTMAFGRVASALAVE